MLEFSVTFLFTFINIGILFFILRRILFKPVSKFMAERSQKIQDAIEQAEKDKNQAKLLLDQYEEQLKNAHIEAEAIVGAARTAAQEQAAAILADGKAAAERLLAAARKQVEAEQRAASDRFLAEAAALVISAAGRLLRREITGEDSRRQAALLLQELGKRPG
jgi:F-type H+-transporting ATPase subunit b